MVVDGPRRSAQETDLRLKGELAIVCATMLGSFTRYIVLEISKIFLIALTVFTSLIMLFGVVKELITERLSAIAILSLIPYILPISLQYTLPASLLFAVCSVYGRLAADNEVMAIKAAGVSPMRIVTPTLIIGFLFSPFAVWMMDLAVSWGRPGIQREVIHHIEEVAYHTLRSTHSYSSGNGFSIFVGDVKDHQLINPEITIQGGNGSPSTISARTGELEFIPEQEALRVELRDAILNLGTSTECRFPHFETSIPLDQASRKGKGGRSRPADIALRVLSEETIKQSDALELDEQFSAVRILMGSSVGRYDWLNSAAMHEAHGQHVMGSERLAKLQTEPWRRWASGFSCFCFVWLGIPLAVWYRTADYWFAFGVTFIPLLLIYYPLFMLGLEQAKDGGWPPCSVWLGNLALLIIGAWFMRKVHVN